jgi:hypothetical protein
VYFSIERSGLVKIPEKKLLQKKKYALTIINSDCVVPNDSGIVNNELEMLWKGTVVA